MIKIYVRIIDDQMAVAPHFQAEIYIIKCYREFFCKAACLQKNIFFHHHAGSCHRTVILGTDDPVAVSRSVPLLLHKAVSRNAAES